MSELFDSFSTNVGVVIWEQVSAHLTPHDLGCLASVSRQGAFETAVQSCLCRTVRNCAVNCTGCCAENPRHKHTVLPTKCQLVVRMRVVSAHVSVLITLAPTLLLLVSVRLLVALSVCLLVALRQCVPAACVCVGVRPGHAIAHCNAKLLGAQAMAKLRLDRHRATHLHGQGAHHPSAAPDICLQPDAHSLQATSIAAVEAETKKWVPRATQDGAAAWPELVFCLVSRI